MQFGKIFNNCKAVYMSILNLLVTHIVNVPVAMLTPAAQLFYIQHSSISLSAVDYLFKFKLF